MAKEMKFAKDLSPGDRVWLKPQSTLGWGFNESAEVFTISRIGRCLSGRGRRVLVYTEERDRPVAWLRGSIREYR